MHRIVTTIRRIDPADLPTTDEQELLNLGIVPIGGDLYSCIAQENRDPHTLDWRVKEGHEHPGEVLSRGTLDERHATLPTDVRLQVLRAQILKDGKRVARNNLAEVAQVLEESVGQVRGGPLVDTESDQAIDDEARRLAGVPDSGVSSELVPVAEVGDDDVVEAEGLPSHSWAGEPRR